MAKQPKEIEPARFPVRQVARTSKHFEFTGQERLFDIEEPDHHKSGAHFAQTSLFRASGGIKQVIGKQGMNK